ncbi:MAG: FAD:protein FMN transferase [Actinobacteria bacterium]|nr:FAD:protein FMN transferase [Actinomycetota bacterium]
MQVVETLSTRVVLRSEFGVMGNTAKITVVGGSQQHLVFAQERLSQLEQMWSRFLPHSEISQLNSAQAKPVVVHRETISLVKYMIAGRRLTHGLFDPTILPALIASGYQASITNPMHITLLPDGAKFNQSLDLITMNEQELTISLPKNVTLDPGAIGKGLAADIVATELMQQNVSGVCVNVGGDLRCIGIGDFNDEWTVGIESPIFPGEIINVVSLRDGAVATSSVRAKLWQHDGASKHHVINPNTGLSRKVETKSLLQVSVLAHECVWAEVFATALLVADSGMNFSIIDENDIAAFVVRADGDTAQSSNWISFQK